MSNSFFSVSVRKWIFLAWALEFVLGLALNIWARDVLFAVDFRPTPPAVLPVGFPTTTIYSRVCDWAENGGGSVPANLVRDVEIYPDYIAVCLIVINRDKVPSSEKERIAQITGLTSARDSTNELDKFIPDDKSVAKLRTSFDLRTFNEQAAIAHSVIADELKLLRYPLKPQPVLPNQNMVRNEP